MKTFKKTTAIKGLLFSALMSASVFSANDKSWINEEAPANQIGVRYSNVTGYGVSYQRRFLNDNYIRVTGWFKYHEFLRGSEEKPIELRKDNMYNYGIDLQRNIIKENRYRVFLFAGAGYGVVEEMVTMGSDPDSVKNPGNRDETLITFGAGGGIEYRLLKNLTTDIGISYKYDWDLQKDVYSDADKQYADNLRKETGLGINIGLNLLF
jgi:opacity protein-like surface antigen